MDTIFQKLQEIKDEIGWHNWNENNYVQDMQFLSDKIMKVIDIVSKQYKNEEQS